jgi:alpha-L-fucosidase
MFRPAASVLLGWLIASSTPSVTGLHAERSTGAAAATAETPAERDQRMRWWREARFGMFIHWGL